MKKISKLKLSHLSKRELEENQMNLLKGGACSCSCSCECVKNCSCPEPPIGGWSTSQTDANNNASMAANSGLVVPQANSSLAPSVGYGYY